LYVDNVSDKFKTAVLASHSWWGGPGLDKSVSG